MPAKKKSRPRPLKSYPSVAHMIADISTPKAAAKFLADALQALQRKVRILEIKVAVLSGEAKVINNFVLGDSPGKPKAPGRRRKAAK